MLEDRSATMLERISMLREHALAVLEGLSAQHSSEPAAVDAMTALQGAANKLGVAEKALGCLVAPSAQDVPAPIVVPTSTQPERSGLAWSADAAAVLGLAEFTVSYALTRAGESDLWLRLLRAHGVVGRALGELGVPERELIAGAERAPGSLAARDLGSVEAVGAEASRCARHRGATTVTTTDLLFAVLAQYDGLVDRVLYAHNVTRQDLLDRLATRFQAPAA
jgi:hypothetical protein